MLGMFWLGAAQPSGSDATNPLKKPYKSPRVRAVSFLQGLSEGPLLCRARQPPLNHRGLCHRGSSTKPHSGLSVGLHSTEQA